MGKRTSYAPGTFSWVDLATSDAGAAKSFYTGLFGWETEDTDAGDGVYTMCRIDGDAVCGLSEMSEGMRAAGVPPNWTSYVTVADADTAAARAKELGGGAIDDAFDVRDGARPAGRPLRAVRREGGPVTVRPAPGLAPQSPARANPTRSSRPSMLAGWPAAASP